MSNEPLSPRLRPRRYLSLWCPFLPADRWQLKIGSRVQDPGGVLEGQRPSTFSSGIPASTRPLVFIDKVKGASRLAAVDALAMTLDLEPGLTLADARARVPALKAVALDPAADQIFLAGLAETAYAFTPSVAFELPHGLVLDITGCAHLFDGEAGLLARLEAALRVDGVSIVKCAIAPTPEMARALARFASAAPAAHSEPASATHVTQARCASGASVALEARLRHDAPRRRDTLRTTRFLSDDEDDNGADGAGTPPLIAHDNTAVRALPVAALEGDPEDMRALRRAGLKTIGDVANRPSVLFTTRFSPAFTRRLARVLGEEDRRITPLRPPPVTTLEHRCPEPILTTDVVLLILGDLIARTVRLLEERGEGGRLFEAAFFRTDGVIRRLRIETSRPAREPALVLRLVRDRLDALADPLDPGFGFDLVRLEVLRAEPWSPAQASLDANAEAEEQLAGLIDRLGAMFGRARVQRLVAADTHIPERAQRLSPAAEARAPVAQGNRRPTGAPHADRSGARNYEGAHGDEGARKYEAWPSSMPGASAPGAPIVRPLHLFERPRPIELMRSAECSKAQCAAPLLGPGLRRDDGGRGTHRGQPRPAGGGQEELGSAPIRFRWRRTMHDITHLEGPERIVDEWWAAPSAYGTRDYYRVETRDGRRFWIFRAHADKDGAGDGLVSSTTGPVAAKCDGAMRVPERAAVSTSAEVSPSADTLASATSVLARAPVRASASISPRTSAPASHTAFIPHEAARWFLHGVFA